MVTLRCTKKLQKRLGTRAIQEGAPSTTILGDWYGDILFTRHARLLVFVSEKSRLAVLVRARDFPTLEERLRAAVAELLRYLGVSEEAIGRETEAMAEVVYAPTNSRSVLGTMNDYYRQLRSMLEAHPGMSLRHYSFRLSETPCGPMKYESPTDVARFLLSEWRSWKFTPVIQ